MFEIKMIMIDECGDEVVVDTFSVGDDLDEDYMEVWEDMKIEKAKERFPEARGFYFENSRDIQRRVNYALHGYEDDYFDDEWEEDDENMSCDYSGFCAGTSCPLYWKCQH